MNPQSNTRNPLKNTGDFVDKVAVRFAISKIKPNYTCNKSGTVVVRVWVNRKGETIKAEAGVRGTTESASCLLNEAKTAALKTTWTPYFDAPEVQIGKITYNFYIN